MRLGVLIALLGALCVGSICSAATSQAVKLENDLYLVEVSPANGAITRIFDKKGGIELITEPRAAGNFRLSLSGAPASVIVGNEQRLTSSEVIPNGLVLRWAEPLKDNAGRLDDVSVTMRIECVDQSLSFQLDAENRTDRQLTEACCPILGGITGLGDRKDTQWTRGDWFLTHPLTPPTATDKPAVAETVETYPFWMGMPWVDIFNTRLNRGLYFSPQDPLGRIQSFRYELGPGFKPSGESDYDLPIGVINQVYSPFTKPGETFEGPPVVVQFHDGDWHTGAKIYRKWFASHFKIRDPRKDWLRQEMAYQDTMFLLPEGNVLWRFKDIPRWAKAAKDAGLHTVLISGWNKGGHDADYPQYVPDQRLGTWEDLRQSIAKCHGMGMKVLFFANTIPIHVDTKWYKNELHNYAALDAKGKPFGPYAFGMGTLSARLGRKESTRQYTWACMGIPKYRSILVRQFKKLAEVGADGLHIDKFVAIGPDTNPLSELPPDRTPTEGQLLCLKEILDACRKVNPNFTVGLESHRWDRTLEYSDVAWSWPTTWSYDIGPGNYVKYTFPEWVDSLAVTQPYDYNVVNNAVRYGYFLLIGPGHYTKSLGDPLYKPLARYIKEVQRLREELKDYIYMGDYLDTTEAQVTGPSDTRYGVHKNTLNGKRAVVAVNFAPEPRDVTVKSFDGNSNGVVRIYAPFGKPTSARLPIKLTVPRERFVVVVEE